MARDPLGVRKRITKEAKLFPILQMHAGREGAMVTVRCSRSEGDYERLSKGTFIEINKI